MPGDRADGRIATPAGTLAYTTAGIGEPVLLVHGLGGTRRTWRHLIDSLAATHTVIAVDLPGHGQSDPPAGDYSLGAHASALRDLLVALGYSRATLVGHSLGGGVALQFAYQFPERVDRLVLISSGGLGAEVTPMLRAATLPGAAAVVAGLGRIPAGVTRRVLPVISVVPGMIARQDARAVAEDVRGMARAGHRQAFLRTARSVIDWRGQTVSASRQLGLLAELPVLVAWGGRDRTIPTHHHRTLVQRLPDARSLEIATAGHYPHETAPGQLLPAIHTFLRTTERYRYDERHWRRLSIRAGG